MGFDQQILEKTLKNMIFHDFLSVWGLALGSSVPVRAGSGSVRGLPVKFAWPVR